MAFCRYCSQRVEMDRNARTDRVAWCPHCRRVFHLPLFTVPGWVAGCGVFPGGPGLFQPTVMKCRVTTTNLVWCLVVAGSVVLAGWYVSTTRGPCVIENPFARC